MTKVRIGGASLNQTPIDWENNFSNIISAIEQAKSAEIKILCLPELSITSYGCQDLFLSEWVFEKAMTELIKIKDYCEDITVAVGLPYRIGQLIYNTTCIIQDKKILGFYAKQILANEGIHYEPRWFTPWESEKEITVNVEGEAHRFGDITFDLYGIKVGLEICEDAWNEKRPACRLFERGVELIINPSASHFSFNKSATRERLVLDSSKQFNCGYLYANQLGNESGRVIYDGDVIIAQKGVLIAKNKRFSFQKTELLYTDFDVNADNPEIGHVAIDHDSSNHEFTHAAGLALYDYLRKSRAKGYALSLSGGADSSSIAVLIYEMVHLGIKQLGTDEFCSRLNISENRNKSTKDIVGEIFTTAYQGTSNSSKETLESAQKLAEGLGAEFTHWSVDNIVNNNREIIEKSLGRSLEWETDDIALQNIQARVRSPLIWMLANIKDYILLTTSNRSEGDVGYATMDGDTSGSLAPVAGVDKPFLLNWLKYAENKLGHSALKYVNNLTPSAELRPSEMSQNDEDDLMPYDLLLKIERLAIFERQSPTQTFKQLRETEIYSDEDLKSYLIKFFRLWSMNQWKRERLAPSFHIDDFNVDPKTWCRFPILSGGFKFEMEQLKKM